MIKSALNELSTEREEFEGFFSKSAFRSGYFVAASGMCVGATAYDVAVLRRHWQALSTGEAQILLIVAGSLVGLLWMSLTEHARVRQFYAEGCISDPNPDSAVYAVLQVAARTANSMLFFGSLALWGLLVVIDKLLSAVPIK